MKPRPMLKVDGIGAAIAAAFLVAVGYFAIAPILSERDESNARRDALRVLERDADAAQEASRATSRRLIEANARAADLPITLRTRADLNSKINEIVTQTESQQLSVQAISPGAPRATERYTRTPIEMAMRGSVTSVAGYLHEMHLTSTDLEITNLEIRRIPDAQEVDVVLRAEWITVTD